MSLHLNIPLLSFDITDYPVEIKNYFAHYKLDFPGVRHHFGYFPSLDKKTAAHIFIPPRPVGTIFFIHGYLDHTGLFSTAIGRWLADGYSVACFDLVGHGLSEGERTAVDDFSTYRQQMYDFTTLCQSRLRRPYHMVGFSTGCSVIFDYLYKHENNFSKVVFLAPLVRSYLWFIAEKAHYLFRNFSDTLPRLFRKTSSNPAYLDFAKKKDHFRDNIMSGSWFDALLEWNKRISSYPRLDSEVLIVQGDRDTVVEWKYNLPFLQEKFCKTTVHMIEGARHQLLNEREELFEQVYSLVKEHFSKKVDT